MERWSPVANASISTGSRTGSLRNDNQKGGECPAVMRSRGLGSADEPVMQESEEPMDPGTLVQEV
jgi:hypothetical protein